jgi:recombination protein RecA
MAIASTERTNGMATTSNGRARNASAANAATAATAATATSTTVENVDADGKVIPASRMNAEREKALDLALSGIEKQFGKGAIMRLGEGAGRLSVEAIPTGAIALDLALGIGGVPRGRVVEIYGPESSGKTTLASHIIAEAQRMGGVGAIIDAEHAFDPVFAQNVCGVDVPQLLISQPDTGEQALEICEMLVRSGAVDVVVVDSVAALTPRAEIEGDMGDSLPGLQARLMSQALRKLTAAISKSRCCVIFINQLREKIGIMFGNPETTPGGRALKFYSSVRLEIRRADTIKQGTDVVGMRAKVTVRKNKVAPPFRVCEFDIMFNEGISKPGNLIDVGTEMAIVKKAGAHFSYGETKIGLGRENAKEFLRQNRDIMAALEADIRANAKDFQAMKVSPAAE